MMSVLKSGWDQRQRVSGDPVLGPADGTITGLCEALRPGARLPDPSRSSGQPKEDAEEMRRPETRCLQAGKPVLRRLKSPTGRSLVA